MCGRFYIESEDTPAELERMLRQASPDADSAPMKGELVPGKAACVLARGRESGAARPFAMRWGYPLEKKLVINARLETAAQRPMFSESWRIRRCLIPASGWFEWDHSEKRPPRYRFRSKTARWLWLAGLYQNKEGMEPRFVVVTRQADGALTGFHDRMPLCFLPGEESGWLQPGEPADDMDGSLLSDGVSWERDPFPPETAIQLSMI